jgi:hypothetical protein
VVLFRLSFIRCNETISIASYCTSVFILTYHFSLRFLTAYDGFPKLRAWKIKRLMDMKGAGERGRPAERILKGLGYGFEQLWEV